MICLENDCKKAVSAVSNFKGRGFLSIIMNLYLNSYGCNYPFQEIYIQTMDGEVSALILRYNSTVYCLVENSADYEEILSFSAKFTECEFISNIPSDVLINCSVDYSPLYEMKRVGECSCSASMDTLRVEDNVTFALRALEEHLNVDAYEDFMLNNSFQHRHKLLDVYAFCCSDQAVSVIGITKAFHKQKAITFLYTKEYFRGNKYANYLLNRVCSADDSDIYLICKIHNVDFYLKNRFTLSKELSLVNL